MKNLLAVHVIEYGLAEIDSHVFNLRVEDLAWWLVLRGEILKPSSL